MARITNFVRSTLLMLVAGIALLIVMVGSSLWLVNANNDYSREILQLRTIRAHVLNMLTSMQDAETGQRGYLLSRDEKYLEPYNEAMARLPDIRPKLRESLSDNPVLAAKLPELDKLTDAKIEETNRTLALAENGDFDGAISLLRTDSGLRYMDEIRDILSTYQTTVDDRLRIIVSEQIDIARILQWLTITAAIAILGVVGGALAIIVQHIRALSSAQEELAYLNKGLEERVNERTEDLIRANQEIQRFAYIVTHDLRAPLVNIMGFLSEFESSVKHLTAYVLADEKKPDEQDIRNARLAVEEDLPEAITFIRSSTRKMDQLINAILKISRDGRRKLTPEKIDLQSLLDTASASVHHQVTSSGGDISISMDVRHVISDRISLDQIFGNLFDNAVKYQQPGRPLQLSVRSYSNGHGRVRIDIKDNGRGIGRQDLERIFELFRRAGEQDQPGEGIGLAHVRSLIRNLGGDITVDSEPGKGSTFRLILPSDLTKIPRSNEL
jgi:signal transduction histidine kinase